MTEAGTSQFRSSCEWGPETEAGLRVHESLQQERAQATDAGTAQPAKRRRTKWGPQATDNPIIVPKISGIELPRNMAVLATALDAGCLELQYDLLQARLHVIFMFCITSRLDNSTSSSRTKQNSSSCLDGA